MSPSPHLDDDVPTVKSSRGALRAVAAEMGADFGDALSEFEKEAGDVWGMLNDLRESDGDAYDAFVRSQMAAGAEMMAASASALASAGKAAGAASAELPPGLIRPERGFVIKTTAARRLAPPKGPPKGGAGGSGDVERRKLFVNFCSHRSIQRPLDGAGRPVEDEDDDNAGAGWADVREVPMVLSKLRDVRDAAGLRAWAVDVVLHPRCVERCRGGDGGAFRARLVRLGLTWAGRERWLSVATGDGEWKAIGARYKGGLGEKGRGVHPLPIGVGGDGAGAPGASGGRPTDVAGGPSAGQGGDPSPVDVVTGDPSELLRRMRSEDSSAAEEGEGRGLSLSAAERRGGIDDGGPLIRDISATKTARRPPPLKKEMRGFLNRKGGRGMPLYKGKSSGDGSSGTGGSYARLLSRCKVVDGAGVVNAERGCAASAGARNDSMKKGGGGGDDNAPFPSPSDSFEGLGNRGFLRKKGGLFDGTAAAAPDGGEEEEEEDEDRSGTFDAEFRDLMEKVDPDFARSFADGARTKAEGGEGEDAAALEELSRALARGWDKPTERGDKGEAGKEGRDRRRDNDGAEAEAEADAAPPAPAEPPTPAPRRKEEAQAAEGARAAEPPDLPHTVTSDSGFITVDIDLSPCAERSVDLDALELEASGNRLRLRAPCGRLLFSREFDRNIDSGRASARLRRRRRRLRVTIPLE